MVGVLLGGIVEVTTRSVVEKVGLVVIDRFVVVEKVVRSLVDMEVGVIVRSVVFEKAVVVRCTVGENV